MSIVKRPNNNSVFLPMNPLENSFEIGQLLASKESNSQFNTTQAQL
jgi:hypothetical protein